MSKRKQPSQVQTRGSTRTRTEQEEEEHTVQEEEHVPDGQDAETESSGDELDITPINSVHAQLGEKFLSKNEGKYVNLSSLFKKRSHDNEEQRVFIKNGQLTTKMKSKGGQMPS